MSNRVVQRATARLWMTLLSLVILVPALSSCSSDDPEMQAPTPLAVRQTSPAQGADDIPLDISVRATFSRDIDVTTVDATTFMVSRNGTPVSGMVAGGGALAEFVPDSLLAVATTYTATLTTGIADAAGNTLPATETWSFTTANVDEGPPTVVSTVPGSAADDVDLHTMLRVTFSEPIDPETVTVATFTLSSPGGNVTGTVSADSVTAEFTPSAPLQPTTVYTATLATGIADDAGNPLEAEHVWSFTTGQEDQEAPQTVGTSPANAAQAVPLGTRITVIFSESVDPASVNETTFVVSDASGPVAGTVTVAGNTAEFAPTVPLDPSTTYTVTLGAGIVDPSGNSLGEQTWAFDTTDQADQVEPTVQGTSPDTGAVAVALGATVSATFSEEIDAATVNSATFRITSTAGAVAGSFTIDGAVATFTPDGGLTASTTYTGTITPGVADMAGNSLADAYVWTFSTIVGQDETPPTLVSTFPLDGATDAPVNTPIFATFSEQIDPASITSATFFVTQPGFPFDILANGTASVDGAVASFTTEIPLDFSIGYTATLTVEVKDLAGNPLSSEITWAFTTEAFQDQVPPTVLSVFPAAADPSVSVSTEVRGNFSENIDPSTVNASTFTLTSSGGPVTGTVYGGGGVAFFDPDADLFIETQYTATLTTGIRDYAGNALAAPYTWTFTTGADQPPVAVPGQDLQVVPYQQVTLDGSRSFDQDGAPIVEYVWHKVFGSDAIPDTFHGPMVQFFAPGDVGGVAFDLVVSNGRNQSAPARIEVHVLEDGNGVYVADTGSDTNLGNRLFPKRTIAAAIHDATLLGTDVYVAGGIYAEEIVLRSDVSIYGGFEPGNWVQRDPDTYNSLIVSPTSRGATGIEVTDLRLDGLLIQAAHAGGTGLDDSASFGLVLLDAHRIDIRGCQIGAGFGADGPAGAAGDDGEDGGDGGNGEGGACDDDEVNADGGLGYGWGGDGGRGGGSWFDPEKAGWDFDHTWFGGDDGENGTSASHPSGAVCLPNNGHGEEVWDCDAIAGTNGRSGCNGFDGEAGDGGSGLGSFVIGAGSVGYLPGDGADGGRGYSGSGGGGGGGSSGQDTKLARCWAGGGNGGGGGGDGGGHGLGGSGGSGGGGSFALAAFNSTDVTVRTSRLISKRGGSGGVGGAGGFGGAGGAGGVGGNVCSTEVARGGDGGPGGPGGDGGAGGGGGGGPSIGMVVANAVVTLYPSTLTEVGTGGVGGSSNGYYGGNGFAGAAFDVSAFIEDESTP